MKHLLRLFLLICTMQSLSVMAQPTQLPEKFSTGELRYDCGFSCAIYWAGGLREINNLYRKKDWKSLAIKINTIGLDTSYSYYGLARAAAGLGYENAARTYFDLAKSTKPYMTISGKHHMGCAPNFVLDFCKEMQMLLAESNVSSSILVAETAQSKEIDVENNSSGQSTGASKREFCEILANNVEKAVCRASELPECGAGVLKNNCFGRVENSNNIFLGEFRLNLPNGFGVEIDKSRNIIMTGQFSAGRVDGVFHSTQYSANAVMVGDMVNTINYRQADGIVVGSYRTESNRVIQQSADTARFPFDIMQFVSLYKPEKIVVAQVSQSNSCSGAGCPGVIQQGEINTQQSQPVVVQVMPSPITQDKSSLISLCKSLSNAEAKLECMENIIKQEDVGKV
ncbi:MAG: hypothetical protein ACKVOY_17340, partial [Burkholderiaceae bacterium]